MSLLADRGPSAAKKVGFSSYFTYRRYRASLSKRKGADASRNRNIGIALFPGVVSIASVCFGGTDIHHRREKEDQQSNRSISVKSNLSKCSFLIILYLHESRPALSNTSHMVAIAAEIEEKTLTTTIK